MRDFFAPIFLVLILSAFAPAAADDANLPTGPTTSGVETGSSESRLDTLFSELKRERNERAAQRIAQRINEEWNQSGSAVIDLMTG